MHRMLYVLAFAIMSMLLGSCLIRAPRGLHGPRVHCRQSCVQWGYRQNCNTRCRAWRNGICIDQRPNCSNTRYCVAYAKTCN